MLKDKEMELNRNEFGDPEAPETGNDEQIDKNRLLHQVTGELFPNDYLQRMVQEKNVPHDIPQFRELISNDESIVQKQFAENSRLDYLLRMKNTLNEKFGNSARLHPHGMTEYDYKCIPQERRPGLERLKMKIRRENYVYLNLHPDIDAMISLFMQKVIKAQPAEPVKFAGEYFTYHGIPYTDFVKQIDEEKKRLKRYRSRSSQTSSPSQVAFTTARHWNPKKFDQVNQVKKLGLGPLALDFGVTPLPSSPHSARQNEKQKELETTKPSPLVEIKPAKKFYYGCKDPGRRDHLRKTEPKPHLQVDEVEGEEQEPSFVHGENQKSSSSMPSKSDRSEKEDTLDEF